MNSYENLALQSRGASEQRQNLARLANEQGSKSGLWHFHALLAALRSLRNELFISVDAFYDPRSQGAPFGNPYMVSEELQKYPTH